MVYWEEEGSTSIVKASQIVQPLQPEKGSKAKVKWDKRVLPATVLEVGGKEKLKRMQTEIHKKKVCNEKVLEEISETAPPKKRKCAETNSKKNKKGKKEATILCVTKPPAEEVPVPLPLATTPAVDLDEPLPDTPSPEVPIHTLPPNDATAQPSIAGSGVVSMQMAKRLPNVYSLRADANSKEILVAASGFLVTDDAVYESEVPRHALLRDCLNPLTADDA